MATQRRLYATARPVDSVIRTLLVDDIPEFLKTTAEFLSIEPRIEIIGQASSGEEALQQVASLAPDLVLTDVAMPLHEQSSELISDLEKYHNKQVN